MPPSHLEVWCKWSCASPGLNFKDQVAVTKTRWLRKFDTAKHVRSEIPLATNERPQAGYSLPMQGCDVELTEVKIVSRSGTWWTLGFEAFGDIDTVPANLTLVLLPDKPFLARTIGSGALMSYPALACERNQPSKLGASQSLLASVHGALNRRRSGSNVSLERGEASLRFRRPQSFSDKLSLSSPPTFFATTDEQLFEHRDDLLNC
jgi:hypothetical protein